MWYYGKEREVIFIMAKIVDVRRATMKRKILLIAMSLVVLSVFLLSLVSIYGFISNAKKNFMEKSDSINNHINVLTTSKFESIEATINNNASKLNLDNPMELNEQLKTIKENITGVISVYYCSTDDQKISIYPAKDTSSLDLTQRQWYISAKGSNGKFCISDVYSDSLTGENIVTFSKAIINDGKLKGILGVDYNLKHLASSISQIKFGEEGSVILTDKQGTIIAGEEKGTNKDKGFIGEELFNKVKNDDSGSISFESGGNDYKVSYYTVEGTDWKLILQMSNSEFNYSRNEFLIGMSIVAILVLILSIIDSLLFSNKVAEKLNAVNEGIFRSSEGDFSQEVIVDSNDELGEMAENFNNMQKNISQLISMTDVSVKNVDKSSVTLADMSEEVSRAMSDVSSTITEISKGSMESAQSLETLLTGLESVSNQINNIDNLSNSIEQLANETSDLSNNGLGLINTVMDKSNETKKSTAEVSEVVLKVRESVRNIAILNETISNITQQTNLLALNAAIEAARAGESGKGFAVVADEIRELAEQTSVSAKNIDEVIKNIVSTVDTAVDNVEKTNGIVETQQEAVQDAKVIFDNISSQINTLTDNLKEITHDIRIVNKNKDKIVNEAENISSIVEETAAGTQEVNATAEEVTASTEEVVGHADRLKQLSGILNKEIDRFKLKEV